MNSVRGRLTTLVVAVLVIVLGSAGFALDRQISRTERQAFDTRLKRTLELSQVTAASAVLEELPDRDRRLDAVLRADDTTLRLTLAGRVLYRSGSDLPRGAPSTVPDGLSTVTLGGQDYRALGTALDDQSLGSLARLDLLANLETLERRERTRRGRIVIVLALTLVLAGLGTVLAADVVLRPLSRLRSMTSEIAAERDLDRRLPIGGGPTEIRTLAESFNAMLGRLQRSASARERAHQATRRFTADAGHELRTPMTALGATISLLGRSDLPDEQRAELATEAQAQQTRFVALLDGLSALARGEGGPVAREPVDLAEVVDQVVAEAAVSHPEAELAADLPDGALTVIGWEPGLRMLAGNLVGNAIVHGGMPPRIAVSLVRQGVAVELVVEDDGPGIDEADYERVFQPFARAGDGSRPGSGLGLAIVDQQAKQHGAAVIIDRSPRLGGARITVRLHAA
ncbi:MAG: HAMP domain-containing sensor histidine kinase [Baekduia sp.]